MMGTSSCHQGFWHTNVNVRVFPRGPTWHRHIDQLCPRYGVEEDVDSGEAPKCSLEHLKSKPPIQVKGKGDTLDSDCTNAEDRRAERPAGPRRQNPRSALDDQYGHHNPKRSERLWSKR